MNEKSGNQRPVLHEQIKCSESGSISAPFLYFEDAAAFADLNGTIRVTLEALRLYSSFQGATAERVAVAHLRMNVQAARALKLALEAALLTAGATSQNP